MGASLDHPAVAAFRSFFNAMNSWGAEMIDYDRSFLGGDFDEDVLRRDQALQRKNLEAIFETYCEAGLKAKRLQDAGMSYDPESPDYDLARELIVSVVETAGKVVIETKQTDKTGWRFRYDLIDTGDNWKLRDNKKRASDKNPQWRPDML